MGTRGMRRPIRGFFDDKEGDVTHPCVPRRPNQPQSTAAPAHPRVPKEACCASLMSGVNRGFGRGGKTGKGKGVRLGRKTNPLFPTLHGFRKPHSRTASPL